MTIRSICLTLLLAPPLAGITMAQSGAVVPMTGLSLHKPVRGDSRLLTSYRAPTSSVTNFGTVDFPEAPASASYGVNDHGQIVGVYGPDLNPDIGDVGFYLSKHTFKKIHFPGAARTQCFRINKSGEITGSYEDSALNLHAYKFERGRFTNIDYPGATDTQSGGVNDRGVIVGAYYDQQGNVYGFQLAGKAYTKIQAPNSDYTIALGINDAGVVVGFYADQSGVYHGFSWLDGTFTTIDYPGAPWSGLWDINNSGMMIGAYGDGNFPDTFEHGFVASNNNFVSFDVPFAGVAATWGTGINDSNQIVGLYIDTNQRFFGFSAKFAP